MTASGQPGHPRGTNDQRRSRKGGVPKAIRTRWFAAATVMAALVVTVSGAAILGPWTNEPPSTKPTSTPAASAGSSQPAPVPSQSVQPLPSLPPLGERPSLIATAAKGSVVTLGAGFLLSGTLDASADDLAKRVTVDPPVELTRTADPATGGVLLQPAAPLQPGVVYRFDLATAAGDPAESWAFQAEMALHVVETLPFDHSNDVPTSTGIEITFDQDGVRDAAEHFRIQPAVKGRFERHARTLVFVPDKHLKTRTVYTVTMTRGVSVEGTGQSLEEDRVFQFETRSRSGTRTVAWLTRDLFDSATGERPVLGVEANGGRRVHVEVYRLPDVDAAIAAYRRLVTRPYWTQWGGTDVIDTGTLRRVVSTDLNAMQLTNGAQVVRLPARLPQGSYVVQTGRRDRPQAILQVTDVAGYVSVSTSKTLVWVNDLKGRRAIDGAEVRVAGGDRIGVTDGTGLLAVETPGALSATGSDVDAAPIITLRTPDRRTAFMPIAISGIEARQYGDFSYAYASASASDFWQVLQTDRGLYRRTDRINLWAMLRSRADGSVPAEAVVRLVPDASAAGYDDAFERVNGVPVASLSLKPNRNGVLSGSIPLVEIAEGPYRLELGVGDEVVAQRYLAVGAIEKPAYHLDVTTGHNVYLAGDRIRTTITARFYEGTPVPRLPLHVNGPDRDRTVRTDAAGVATFATTAVADQYDLQHMITAGPARAEEGEIDAEREYIVFPSSRWLDARGTIENSRVRVTGTVRLVDVERLERQLEAESIWSLDPGGKPVGGANVRLRFTELVPKRTQTGTAYDFIEKRVVPIYDYDVTRRIRATITVRTNPDGTFSGSLAVPNASHDYDIDMATGDADGRLARLQIGATAERVRDFSRNEAPYLAGPRSGADGRYSVGDKIDLTMHEGDGTIGRGRDDRYLFFLAHSGIRMSVVQTSPRYVTTFSEVSIPNVTIQAVRFTGTGYLLAGSGADFRTDDRALTVELTPDQPSYRPGDQVRLGVRTLDRDGKPVPATVVLRAVDEKLYTIGAATESYPLDELYERIEDGILAQYASHRSPENVGGGDTGGGGDDRGDRSDFRDVVLFQAVDTDAAGRASVSFDLSDDLTSWHIAASGFTADLRAGEGTASIPVGLPMFIDTTIASEYLLADRPSIHVRAYGTALHPGDPVTFTVASETLPMSTVSVSGKAFEDLRVELPKLSVGLQRITIGATASPDGGTAKDRVTRTFRVTASRLTHVTSSYSELVTGSEPSGGDELTTLVFSDAGRGRSLAILTSLLNEHGPRLDRLIAADLARQTLVAADPADAATLAPVEALQSGRYQQSSDGLTLLPYSSPDLRLSSLVALFAADSVDRDALAHYLRAERADPKATRERQVMALAGLAALRDPVLPAIKEAGADPKLTIRERLFVGLGAAAIGDAATARAVEQALVDAYAEDLGDQRRLRVGEDKDDDAEATALLAVLAASIGDPDASGYWAYVEANPSTRDPLVLQAAAFARAWLARMPTAAASFAYTVDGKRTVVDLAPGEAFAVIVAAAQRPGLHLEALAGSVGVSSTWREPARPGDFTRDPDVVLLRTVTSTASSGDLVRVDLRLTFGAKARNGCYDVVDFVPSGLRPVSNMVDWYYDEEERPDYTAPYDQTSERVSFCAYRPKKASSVLMRYYARVVTSGTYMWEPAIARYSASSTRATLTAPDQLTID